MALNTKPLIGILLLASALSASAQDVPEVGAYARVDLVEVVASSAGTDLQLNITGFPDWSVSADEGRTIILTLPGTIATLQNFKVSGALVEEVLVTTGTEKKVPYTRIAMKLAAGEIGHAVVRDEAGLRVLFRELRPGSAALSNDLSLEDVGLQAPPEVDLTARPDAYRIGAGDLLRFDVFGIVELQRTARVQSDGRVALPVLGRFAIAGQSLEDAERSVARMLRDQGLATNPEVFISVEEYQSLGVYVQGAVKAPGIYQVPGGKPLLELLSEAGGLTERNPTGQRILVLRPDTQGGQHKIEISAEKLLAQGDISLNIAILPGDMVMVPEPVKFDVFVTGAVTRPGPVAAREGMTLLQAITAAGGPTPRAKIGNVQILRHHEDGTQTTLDVDLKAIRRGTAEDIPLQPQDTIVLREWFF